MARYVVVEYFKGGNATAVYQRFQESGRLIPAGLTYIDSWVAEDLSRCFQVIDCDDESILKAWAAKWKDLVDFEFYSVITSDEAKARALAE